MNTQLFSQLLILFSFMINLESDFSSDWKNQVVDLSGNMIDQYKLEIIDDPVELNYRSVLAPSTVEESLVRLYLHQDLKNYLMEYDDTVDYRLLGIPHSKLINVQKILEFEVLYKLYYEVNGREHCLMRVLMSDDKGNQKVHHSRLIMDNGVWRFSNMLGADPDYLNKFMLNIETKYLKELFIDKQSDEKVLDIILNDTYDATLDKIHLDKLNSLYQQYKSELREYRFTHKKYFGIKWWTNYSN